jgi:aminoglycoside phosphotransferase (APT) family kinase protein
MQLIDEHNAASYLRASGRIPPDQEIVVRELAGGVSNVVLLVSHSNGEPYFVLKQARGQLRVPEPWFSDIERVWREIQVLEIAERLVNEPKVTSGSNAERHGWHVSVPRLLFIDRENYLFAMSAVPSHQPWKQTLLAGNCDQSIASACGRLLGLLHAGSWNEPDVSSGISDRKFFEQLRIDPYYRHIARRQPAWAQSINRLIESLERHPRCLVHGDFSPKNILVADRGLTLVDFEVGHCGDPAFDIGFFLSHLVLKAFHFKPRWPEYIGLTIAFWAAYEPLMRRVIDASEFQSLMDRGIANLAGCLLARVDGKSKVEYLGPAAQDAVRSIAPSLWHDPPGSWRETTTRLST